MKTRTYTAAALLALFFGLFGCFEDSAFDNIGGGLTTAGLPIGNLLIAPTYTVTYDGNGSTGGDVPVDGNEYITGGLVTVLGNTGFLTLGGNTFVGWNSQSDGNGITYAQGNILAMGTANITLYAKWSPLPTHTVTYDDNGATSGTVPVDLNNYLEDDVVTVKSNSGSLTITGYVFAGWNTASNGSGTTYNPYETFTMGSDNVTLYAIFSDQWAQDAYLKASNAEASDYFGSSVAVDGSTIVVGAYGEDSSQTTITNTNGSASSNNSASSSGAAYVFKTSAGNWYQDAYLKASNAEASDGFGGTVAVSGDYIAVGAPGEDSSQTTITNTNGSASTNNDAGLSGAVYVFVRLIDPDNFRIRYWAQDAYLKPSNTGASDAFGASIAMDGTTIVVGATGEDSSQTTITNTNGSASTNNSAYSAGAVYVFKLIFIKGVGYEWRQDAYLKASNSEAYDYFGTSVAVSGDTIVVGAYGEDSNQTSISNSDGSASSNNDASTSGAAYVFKRDISGNWIQDAYLKSSNSEGSDRFGYSVGVDDDTIVVGAYYEDSNQTTVTNSDGSASIDNSVSSSGAAYVFKKNVSNNWVQDAYLKAPAIDSTDYFGRSVAVSGDFIVVGAHYEDSSQVTITNTDGTASGNNDVVNSGAAYVFKKNASDNWVQDAYLKASNAGADDCFGNSVGVSGYTIVVGAYYEDSSQVTITNTDGSANSDNSAADSGAAYVFTLK